MEMHRKDDIFCFGMRNRVLQDPGPEESQVQQHLAEETDINFIMAKYARTGELRHITPLVGEYGDFSDAPDYQTALNRIMEAESLFMELPARVRDRFGNDPAQFVAFATDGKNIDELRSLGLAPEAPKPPEPQIVKVVTEPEGPGNKHSPKGDQ